METEEKGEGPGVGRDRVENGNGEVVLVEDGIAGRTLCLEVGLGRPFRSVVGMDNS